MHVYEATYQMTHIHSDIIVSLHILTHVQDTYIIYIHIYIYIHTIYIYMTLYIYILYIYTLYIYIYTHTYIYNIIRMHLCSKYVCLHVFNAHPSDIVRTFFSARLAHGDDHPFGENQWLTTIFSILENICRVMV